MNYKEYNPERKWLIEVNESQLFQIIHCVEDIHRFLCGQMELDWATSFIADTKAMWEMRNKLSELQPLMTPGLPRNASYGWSGSTCPNKYQKEAIGETYAIYRNLRHCVEKFRDSKEWNVYKSETLTCGHPLAICYPKPENEENEQWEYKRILVGRGGGIRQSSIEQMKTDGWELQDVVNGVEYIFKRKIQK